MKIITAIITLTIILSSCNSDNVSKERQMELISQESKSKFEKAITDFKKYKAKINIDSVTNEYVKISSESVDRGYYYAEKVLIISKSIKDSIIKIQEAESTKQGLEKLQEWYKTKPGKIQKKHPTWSREDCEDIAENRIWIGMSLDMLKCERGNPSRANPSNYGSGVNWQWCWDDYTPSCFYGGDDGIITSYN